MEDSLVGVPPRTSGSVCSLFSIDISDSSIGHENVSILYKTNKKKFPQNSLLIRFLISKT